MKSTNKIISKDLIIRTVFFIMVISVLAFPEKCSEGVREGVRLFTDSIFPSLFPFFVLSSFAANSNVSDGLGRTFGAVPKLLSVESGEYSYIISVLSGYPTSTKMICEGYLGGNIRKKDAEILLILCSNGSAAFIMSFIGSTLLGNTAAALILLTANYLTPIVTAYMFSRSCPKNGTGRKMQETSQKFTYISAFTNSVSSSVISAFNVGGYVVIFSIIINILRGFSGNTVIASLLLSVLELSSGCRDIAGMNISPELRIAFMGFMVCFGGVCVMFQCMSFIEKTDLDVRKFFICKLISGFIGGSICFVLSKIFLSSHEEVFSPMIYGSNFNYREINFLLLSLMVTIILYTVISFKAESENEDKGNFKRSDS